MLKISGEFLAGKSVGAIHDKTVLEQIVSSICDLVENNFSVVTVIGGGNICRGRDMTDSNSTTLDIARADYVGMVSTVVNSLVVHRSLISRSVSAHVLSSIGYQGVCDVYSLDKALKLIENSVVLLAGGLGIPYMTTDATAIVRALELQCDCIVKLTGVAGVFSSDPKQNPDAIKYDRVNYEEILSKNLKIMDITAATLALSFKPKMLIMPLYAIDKLLGILQGKEALYDICTFVE